LTSAFRAKMRALKVPIRFHDLRHSHATVLFALGTHPKIVQERLGHSSVKLTLDTYSHMVAGMDTQAAREFDKSISTVQNKHRGRAKNVPKVRP